MLLIEIEIVLVEDLSRKPVYYSLVVRIKEGSCYPVGFWVAEKLARYYRYSIYQRGN